MRVLSEPNDATATISGATIHVVRGCDSILRLQRVLADLSVKCGQPGVMDDVGYFLTKPGTLRRVPHLMLFAKAPVLDVERLTADDLLGAVLLYRYMLLGCGIGMFSTNDRSGRGTLIAPAALRSTLADMATRSLMDQGVLAVLISFRDGDSGTLQKGSGESQRTAASTVDERTTRWVWRQREMADYLPLEETFDKTLAKIGTRTRRNMRYYRKRAEAELGCVFLPSVEIEEREFLKFNCECMYAVPAKVASWRYHSLRNIETPLFMGIKDRGGRWLSMLGGRRHQGGSEILWQMNRSGLSAYSLSIVMRSYFMEHEIAHGMTKLYMEGGTAHPMRFSFVNDKVTDLAVVRRSRLGMVVPTLAQLFIKPDNDLALMLLDKSLFGGKMPNGSRHLASVEVEEEGS
ncbi:MAG TPA: hypothetical protein VHS13_13275 [Edaphobacter sp.]|jgi:hypothetical protein|nr:hypothetical protein [Edaphobacter sp.]